MKKLLLFFVTTLFASGLGAQSPQTLTCNDAVDLNVNQSLNGGGPAPEDPSINYGCVNAATQHIWYGYFTVCDSGTLTISSSCGVAWDDVDLVVWGPLTSTTNICAQLTPGSIVACSSTASLTETVNLGMLNTGDIYVIAAVCDTDFIEPSYLVSGTADVTGACPGPPPGPGPGCAIGAVDLNVNPMFGPQGSLDEPTINYGCINTSGQWMWYGYFTVCQGGSMNIHGAINTSAYDADIVVWGPFPNTTNLCSQLNAGTIFGCAASTGTDVLNMGTISIGEVYMVAIACNDSTANPYLVGNGTADISGTCVPPPPCAPVNGPEMMCLVTVDSATQEYQLIWNEVAGNPVTHFGILKWDYLGVPQEIDTVQISSLSTYIDVSANPAVHTERYSIKTYDTCATFWGPTGYIEPVFCQSSLSTQGTVNVAWSHYVDSWGNGPVYYVIYRGATPATMVSIDTVASFINYYTDINPLAGQSFYKIGVALTNACVPMRLNQNAQTIYFVQSFSNAAPVTVVGIGENSLQEVALFPNPTEGILTVKNLFVPSVMRVYDVSGRIVSQQQLQPNASQQISLENLESGMYSMIIENENGFFRENVVIRH